MDGGGGTLHQGSIDISRIMMRTFGIIYALRSVLTSRGDKPRLAWLSDMSLLLYHPCETSYWLLTVSNWGGTNQLGEFAAAHLFAFVILFGFLWSVFAIASTRRLRQLRAAQLSLKLAQDEAHALGDDKTGVAISAQEPDGGRTMQLLNEDMAALATDASVERQRLIKLLLDATMNLNWAIDHPTRGLSSFGIDCLALPLRGLGYGCHTMRMHRPLRRQRRRMPSGQTDRRRRRWGKERRRGGRRRRRRVECLECRRVYVTSRIIVDKTSCPLPIRTLRS